MTLIEQAKYLAKHPLRHEEVLAKQNEINGLVRAFMNREIDIVAFREQLIQLHENDDMFVVLTHPGPVLGFLLKLGLDPESATNLAEEERAHYRVAQEQGLSPKIIFSFSQREIVEEPTGMFLNAFVSYEIPDRLDPDTLRYAIRTISLAPENPSQDDLAKLP